MFLMLALQSYLAPPSWPLLFGTLFHYASTPVCENWFAKAKVVHTVGLDVCCCPVAMVRCANIPSQHQVFY